MNKMKQLVCGAAIAASLSVSVFAGETQPAPQAPPPIHIRIAKSEKSISPVRGLNLIDLLIFSLRIAL